MKDELTVLIPTYNRKEKLTNTLLRLEKQFDNNFQVLILDNASPFSIEEEVLTKLSSDFSNCIKVVKRKYNVGLGNNIAGLFLYCETKWGWLLGDDDVVADDAVNTIADQTKQHPNCAGFWFALDERFHDEVVLNSLDKFIDLKIERGMFDDSGYLSNKVYNFEYFHEYSDIVFTHAYTMISFTLGIFEILKKGLEYRIIFNKRVVNHPGFEDGKPTWNYFRVASGMRTVVDYQVSKDWKVQKKYIYCSMFDWRALVGNYLKSEKLPDNYRTYLKNIYYNCYKYSLPLKEKILCYIKISIVSTKLGFYVWPILSKVKHFLKKQK